MASGSDNGSQEEINRTEEQLIKSFYKYDENDRITGDEDMIKIEDLRSFRNPHGFIKKLVRAGFEAYQDKTNEYNQEEKDESKWVWVTKCYKCQLVLSDWREEDLPMDEHFKAMSSYCPLVKEFYKHLKQATPSPPEGAVQQMDMEVEGESSAMENPDSGDDGMDIADNENAVCTRCKHKNDKITISPCQHVLCRFCFNNKPESQQDKCPKCDGKVEDVKVTMPLESARALASKEQRRKEHLMMAKLYSKCKEEGCGKRDKIVLYQCTHIVCVHYKDDSKCPNCNAAVEKCKSAHDSVLEGLAMKLGAK